MPAALNLKSPGLDRAISRAGELELNVGGMGAGKDQTSPSPAHLAPLRGKT